MQNEEGKEMPSAGDGWTFKGSAPPRDTRGPPDYLGYAAANFSTRWLWWRRQWAARLSWVVQRFEEQKGHCSKPRPALVARSLTRSMAASGMGMAGAWAGVDGRGGGGVEGGRQHKEATWAWVACVKQARLQALSWVTVPAPPIP